MTRVLAACNPKSDAGFAERVRRVVAQDQWDLGSPEGIALVQAVLRQSYPMAAVLSRGGMWSGGVRRTLVLDVFRDGSPEGADLAGKWTRAVYDHSGPTAYRAAARILGEGRGSEEVVEEAFRDVLRFARAGLSVEAAGLQIQADAVALATRAEAARATALTEGALVDPPAIPELATTSISRGPVRRSLRGDALSCLLSSQRAALELSVLEDLKVSAIAERMQTTPSVVHRELGDALRAVDAGERPSVAMTLGRWREAEQRWAQVPETSHGRPAQGAAVAHAWLDFQVASDAIPPRTAILVTDTSRRFVTTSANAGSMMGRPSMIGLRIDDIAADYAQPLVPELWNVFDANGSMSGDYDCDRPGQAPIRVSFIAVWGRPLPDLQVGYLQAAKSEPLVVTPAG